MASLLMSHVLTFKNSFFFLSYYIIFQCGETRAVAVIGALVAPFLSQNNSDTACSNIFMVLVFPVLEVPAVNRFNRRLYRLSVNLFDRDEKRLSNLRTGHSQTPDGFPRIAGEPFFFQTVPTSSRSTDPGLHSRLFSPLPTAVRALHF